MSFRVVAIMLHDERPDAFTSSSVSFATAEEAAAWMNGPEGDLFSEACTLDCEVDVKLKDYWLDEIEVWSQAQVDERIHSQEPHPSRSQS